MDEQSWKDVSENLSTNSIRTLHRKISECLAKDDSKPDGQKLYKVRELPDWKQQADIFEAALKKRGIDYEPIQW